MLYELLLMLPSFNIPEHIGVETRQPIVIPLIIPKLETRHTKPRMKLRFYLGARFYKFDWTYTDIHEEITCLAENMFFEAGNQTQEGQIWQALTTLNRVRDNRFPNSVCKVVWQQTKSRRTGKMVAQFSWTADGKSNIAPKNKQMLDLTRLASAMIYDGSLDAFVDVTQGAINYHADYVHPDWKMVFIDKIGAHLFYK